MFASTINLKWAVIAILNEGTRYEHVYCSALCAEKEIAEEVALDDEADYLCCNGKSDPDLDWFRTIVVPSSDIGDYGINLLDCEFHHGVVNSQDELVAMTVGYEEEEVLANRREDWDPVLIYEVVSPVAA